MGEKRKELLTYPEHPAAAALRAIKESTEELIARMPPMVSMLDRNPRGVASD